MATSGGTTVPQRCCAVAVNRPLFKRFTYLIPSHLDGLVQLGSRVEVPFGRTKLIGFVTEFTSLAESTVPANKLKAITAVVEPIPPLAAEGLALAQWLSDTYLCSEGEALALMAPHRSLARHDSVIRLTKTVEETNRRLRKTARRQQQLVAMLARGPVARGTLLRHGAWVTPALRGLAKHGLVEEYRLEDSVGEEERPFRPGDIADHRFHRLTSDQQRACSSIIEAMDSHATTLLHGVTGSGKTEIYLHLIRHVLLLGKTAVFLVPEISLTVPMIRTFTERFGRRLAVLHSRLTSTARYREWMRLKRGDARVVLGARSAVFAPVDNPGLFIIDEEGESSYKQSDSPRYHARDVALERARRNEAALVLGSATPSLESYYRATRGDWQYVELPERIHAQAMPAVTLVDMGDEFAKKRNRSVFSMELKRRLAETFAGDGQVLLFLNRRGHSTYVFCRSCSYVCLCQDCEIPLTYHFTTGWLRCHHCGRCLRPPSRCPECESPAIRYCGAGTQKVEQEFKVNYPTVPYARMDSDTTTKRNSHDLIIDDFEQGRTRCLIGTQMIARGFDFQFLDVAGIVNADATLNMPDFRSAERTFQLVAQVAGRVGRRNRPSHVVVQTYSPAHPALQAAARHDYQRFAEDELELRQELSYPPFSRLIAVFAENECDEAACDDLVALQSLLQESHGASTAAGTVYILGPGPAFTYRLKNRFRWQLLLKLPCHDRDIFAGIRTTLLSFTAPRRSKLKIDVDPMNPV